MKDSTFQEDPFLCADCQKLGYCKKYGESGRRTAEQYSLHSHDSFLDFSPQLGISDENILNWVPVRTASLYANTPLGNRIQEAHDLFHQAEYEQASYIYQDMIATHRNCDEIVIGLAASFFFLKKYEEAAAVASGLNGLLYQNFPQRFSDFCAIKSGLVATGHKTESSFKKYFGKGGPERVSMLAEY